MSEEIAIPRKRFSYLGMLTVLCIGLLTTFVAFLFVRQNENELILQRGAGVSNLRCRAVESAFGAAVAGRSWLGSRPGNSYENILGDFYDRFEPDLAGGKSMLYACWLPRLSGSEREQMAGRLSQVDPNYRIWPPKTYEQNDDVEVSFPAFLSNKNVDRLFLNGMDFGTIPACTEAIDAILADARHYIMTRPFRVPEVGGEDKYVVAVLRPVYDLREGNDFDTLADPEVELSQRRAALRERRLEFYSPDLSTKQDREQHLTGLYAIIIDVGELLDDALRSSEDHVDVYFAHAHGDAEAQPRCVAPVGRNRNRF